VECGENKVRVKGASCFWKTSNTAINAGAGAILTFNPDGSANLNTGAVEIGQGVKTVLVQIAAERLGIDAGNVHPVYEVDTQTSPTHWKTAASRSTMLVGRAVMEAADDAICQMKETASRVLGCPVELLDIRDGRVFIRNSPSVGLNFADIVDGFICPEGGTVGGKVIGRGSYVVENISGLDPGTGKGSPGPEWAVGAQAVEIEYDRREYTYRLVKAASVIDIGRVINPGTARAQVAGGMSIGLSFASREAFDYSERGIIENLSLRTYKLIRFGENPEYIVDFVETPYDRGPYGARGIGEYGVIGMPAALANSLSRASGVPLNELPLVPELIWRKKEVTS
jgi:CO/xanthine dehydrogenase Mo-binding subunit